MSIRLNKAIRELNIGIQTVSEFLEKKYGIDSVDPNLKLTDEQYSALKTEFSTDAEVRSKAEQMIQKKDKKSDRKEAARQQRPKRLRRRRRSRLSTSLARLTLTSSRSRQRASLQSLPRQRRLSQSLPKRRRSLLHSR